MVFDMRERLRDIQVGCKYPGMMNMVAMAIMIKYKTLADAEGIGLSFSSALEDTDIPGSGSAVSKTLFGLRACLESGCSPDEASLYLIQQWKDYAGHQQSYAKIVDLGIEKYRDFEGEFKVMYSNFRLK